MTAINPLWEEMLECSVGENVTFRVVYRVEGYLTFSR